MKYGGGGEHGGPRTVRAPWSCSSGGQLGARRAVNEPPVGRLLFCFFFSRAEDGQSSAETFFYFILFFLHWRFERLAVEVRCNAAVRSHFPFFFGREGGVGGDTRQGREGLEPAHHPRRDAVARRREAARELGAAAARGLGGSSGLRRPSVLHRPQHPANFVD